MDESGVLSQSNNQRYFALGLLKLYNTTTLYEAIKIINDKAKEKVNKDFEFKFSKITKIL